MAVGLIENLTARCRHNTTSAWDYRRTRKLNLYMNYYKHEVMQADDNPPIGLLLCADYGETTVQYGTLSTAGLPAGVYAVQIGKLGSTLIRK